MATKGPGSVLDKGILRKKNRCADEDVSSILDTEYSYPEYKPCWYYNNHGYCEKGTACSFAH